MTTVERMTNTAELRRLLDAATPGPWSLGKPDLKGTDAHMCEIMTAYATTCEILTAYATKNSGASVGCYDVICRTWSPDTIASSIRLSRQECYGNATLIAAAINALPGLLDELDRLRAGHWKIIDHHNAMVETEHNPIEESAWREASKVSEYALGLRAIPYDPA